MIGNGSALIGERHDVEDEMAAFDRLPEQLRRAIADCRDNVSALGLERMLPGRFNPRRAAAVRALVRELGDTVPEPHYEKLMALQGAPINTY